MYGNPCMVNFLSIELHRDGSQRAKLSVVHSPK